MDKLDSSGVNTMNREILGHALDMWANFGDTYSYQGAGASGDAPSSDNTADGYESRINSPAVRQTFDETERAVTAVWSPSPAAAADLAVSDLVAPIRGMLNAIGEALVGMDGADGAVSGETWNAFASVCQSIDDSFGRLVSAGCQIPQ